jgi:TetR/AcrR family transcriptional repressor of nem operon
MRYTTDHRQETRARVLAEASKQIRAKGPHGVAIVGIMKRAGLTHGGFYAHFRSKDALVAAAIGTMFDNARARWNTETENRDARAGLAAYVDFYLSPAHRDTTATGCPIAALVTDLPRLTTACRTAFAAGARRLTDLIAAKLAALGHGEHEALASSVVAELVGALSLARVEPNRARSDAMLAASRRLLRARVGLGGRS